MRAWPIALLVAPILLTGCGTPAPEPTATPSPDPIVNASTSAADEPKPGDGLLVGTDDLNQSVPAVQHNAGDVDGPVHYVCGKGLAVLVHHDLAWDVMRLTIGSATYELNNTVSASGSKYRSENGRAPGKSLIWWSKGDDAMLIEAPVNAAPDSAEETSVDCHQAD
jgi:membrane-bound inhibitor of C-type lysozyme